ncbi:MAG: alpha/beta hydrolase [SAR324 cluster bacterium]|nr:alpha/beta hydrolase [SAR324 cluster bacterium]
MFREYDQAALDAQYNLRVRHPDHEQFSARWEIESKRVRAELPCRLDVAYGPSEAEKLDVFLPREPGAPVLLFIHGGYWQWRDKADFSFIAEPLVNAGFAVVMVNYGLAPSVNMDEIVRQNRAAVAWTIRNVKDIQGDPERIVVSGHSAGGHLTAVMLGTDWSAEAGLPAQPIRGGCAISGLFELEPIRLSYLNEAIGMDAAAAERHSPLLHLPRQAPPLSVVVGGAETEEFLRHSTEYAAAWRAEGLAGEHLVLPGLNHFSILDEFLAQNSPMLRAIHNLAEGEALVS